MGKYSTAASDVVLYTFVWPTATTTNTGAPSTYSKLTTLANVFFDLYPPTSGTALVNGANLAALPVGYTLYSYSTRGFSIRVPSSAFVTAGRHTMIVYANPALGTAAQYADQIAHAEIDDSYEAIWAASVAAAASAATAATQATTAATRASTINTKIGTPTPPSTLSQTVELAYAVTNNAKRFDAATGRLYLRNSANSADLGYWPCFQDYAGLVPATSYSNIIYQGRFIAA